MSISLFHRYQIQKWKEQGISHISCMIISGGCAGNKVSITPDIHPGTDIVLDQEGISIHTENRYSHLFENARLTETNGKWILTSTRINTHCGCGSSFSVSTGNPIQDKIAQIKLKMKKKKETC